jgi:PAS domain S-box-containing protein
LKPHEASTPAELRRIAEAKLATSRPDRPPQSHADIQRLQYELEVHEIELELQNQELRAARSASEAALERYTDLFDFAPVGYFNLGPDGGIQLVNLTGAKLTGIERSQLIGRRLGLLVEPHDRKNFSDFLDRTFASGIRQTCELALETESRTPLIVRLEGTAAADQKICRVAMMAITEKT